MAKMDLIVRLETVQLLAARNDTSRDTAMVAVVLPPATTAAAAAAALVVDLALDVAVA